MKTVCFQAASMAVSQIRNGQCVRTLLIFNVIFHRKLIYEEIAIVSIGLAFPGYKKDTPAIDAGSVAQCVFLIGQEKCKERFTS